MGGGTGRLSQRTNFSSLRANYRVTGSKPDAGQFLDYFRLEDEPGTIVDHTTTNPKNLLQSMIRVVVLRKL